MFVPAFFPAPFRLSTPFRPGIASLRRSRSIMMPVAVLTCGKPHQCARYTVGIHPAEARLRGTGTVPAIGSPAPVPATLEEHLFLEAFHHLDAWLYHHQMRNGG